MKIRRIVAFKESGSRSWELSPNDGRKSFYGKAKVEEHADGRAELYSYGTHVATIYPDGNVEVFNMQSATTLRHIKAFLEEFDIPAPNKKYIEENYFVGSTVRSGKAVTSSKSITAAESWDLSGFGYVQLEEARDILSAWLSDGLPEDFYEDEITMNFNPRSGAVFLSNSNYDAALINPETGRLESWYNSPYTSVEGFKTDLQELYDGGYTDDEEEIDWLREIGVNISDQPEDNDDFEEDEF